MNDLQKSIHFWTSLGVAVIPVYYKSKQPKVRWLNYTSVLPNENDLARWFCGRYINAAVITGWQDLCIIDFDNMSAFKKWENWAAQSSVGSYARKVLQQSRMSLSARGVHIYTLCPDALNLKLPGIDILANHKYALIPPSIHPSGSTYRLERDAMPAFVPSIMDLFPADVIEPTIEKALAASPLTERPALIPAAASSSLYDPWDSAGTDYRPVSRVDKILAHYRIQDFFPDAVPSGADWMLARCPFHHDRYPSLSIDLRGQTCKCLASHGCTPLPLDVIGLYAKLHNISNTDAISILSERL